MANLCLTRAGALPPGQEFTVKKLAAGDWAGLSRIEKQGTGKRFRELLQSDPLGQLKQWKESDNEWRYVRR